MSGGTQMVTVRCEKHGLRYNPNLHSGCVRCRKEAGEAIGPPTPAAPPAAAAGRESVIPALAVAVLLVVATGSAFFFAHRQWHDNVGKSLNEDFVDEDELTPEQREMLERWREATGKSGG